MLLTYIVAIPITILVLILQVGLAFKSFRFGWYFSVFSSLFLGSLVLFLSNEAWSNGTRLSKLMADLVVPPGTPITVNPSTKLLKVDLYEDTVLYSYEVTSQQNLPSFSDAIGQNCNLPSTRAVLELGGKIVHEYQQSQAIILTIAIDREDCR